MATNAITYDFVNDQTREAYNDIKKEYTTGDFRKEILSMTENVLSAHSAFENVWAETDRVGSAFREDELIAIMSVIHGLVSDVKEYGSMSRWDHLKAAVFGQ